MKKHLLVIVTVLFLVALSVSLKPSCAAPAKPIELKFSTFVSLTHQSHVNVYAPFAKELEERTQGRVKITFYPGEALGKARDHYDMAMRGIADMAIFLPGYTPGRFPLSGVMELPINIPSGKIGSRVVWELYPKYLKQEYAGVKVLQLFTFDPYQIQTTKKLVKNLGDLKGMRLRASGPQPTAILRAWSASPLTIPVPELYDSLQKGMADGAYLNFTGVEDFKLGDLLRYRIVVNGSTTAAGIVMNMNTWNSLPPDIQKIMDELTGLKIAVQQGAECDRHAQMWAEAAKKAGVQIYELPPAERAIWMEKAKPINDAWIADMDKKGLPGKKVFEEAISLVDRYSKQ